MLNYFRVWNEIKGDEYWDSLFRVCVWRHIKLHNWGMPTTKCHKCWGHSFTLVPSCCQDVSPLCSLLPVSLLLQPFGKVA